MERTVDIALPPHEASQQALVIEAAAEAAGFKLAQVQGWRVDKRSIDARSKVPLFRLRVTLSTEHALAAGGLEGVELAVEDLSAFGSRDADVADQAHGHCAPVHSRQTYSIGKFTGND